VPPITRNQTQCEVSVPVSLTGSGTYATFCVTFLACRQGCHAVAPSGDAHRSGGVDPAQDLLSGGGSCRPGGLGSVVQAVVIFGQVPSGVGGHDDAAVGDVEQSVGRLHLDVLSSEVAPHVVAVLEDADAPGPVDPAADPLRWRCLRCALAIAVGIDHFHGDRLAELEATDRSDIADRLVRSRNGSRRRSAPDLQPLGRDSRPHFMWKHRFRRGCPERTLQSMTRANHRPARSSETVLVQCFWPRATSSAIEEAAARAATAAAAVDGGGVRFLGSTFIPEDEVVLFEFAGEIDGVRDASERAALPYERIIPAVELEPPHGQPK
jgi:hypothetical protein